MLRLDKAAAIRGSGAVMTLAAVSASARATDPADHREAIKDQAALVCRKASAACTPTCLDRGNLQACGPLMEQTTT